MVEEDNNNLNLGDPAKLIESIKKKASESIALIRKKNADIVKHENEIFNKELQAFGDKITRETDEIIKNEAELSENKTVIELKKLELKSNSEFIELMIEQSINELIYNDDNRYFEFLKQAIKKSFKHKTAAEYKIRLANEDIKYSERIEQTVKHEYGDKIAVVIASDLEISRGGIIIDDIRNSISYNYSIERIAYRKKDIIRKEVMKIINAQG